MAASSGTLDRGSRADREDYVTREHTDPPPALRRWYRSSVRRTFRWSPLAGLLTAALATLTACHEDLGLEAHRFACATDSDCIRGTVCDPTTLICTAPESLASPDAGVPDARPDDADATVSVRPDAEVVRIEWGELRQPAVESWLYTGLTAPEVDARIAEHRARVVDLETEGDDDAVRYAVVLVEDTDAVEEWWVSTRDRDAMVAHLQGLDARPIDVEPVRTGTTIHFAAVIRRDTFSRAGRYIWWMTTPAAIEAKAIERRYILLDADRRPDGLYTSTMQPRVDEVVTWRRDLSPRALADEVASGERGLTYLDRGAPQTFSVLTSTCPCVRSALVYDLDEDALRAEATARQMRIQRFDIYLAGGVRRFAAILVDDGG